MKERFEEAKLVATITVGIVTAEMYLDEGGYSVFLVGDNVKVLVECFPSIEDCPLIQNFCTRTSQVHV